MSHFARFPAGIYSPLVESLSSPNRKAATNEAIALCAADVRRYDPDRYFASLFADEDGRRALFALYAFNLEVAKTRETVSEPMLGQIRLQWWREAIEGIYADTPRDHAVVTALAEAVSRQKPPRARFDRLIDGREFDLEDRPPETLDELLAYVEATSGELVCLALEMLGARDDAAMAAGRAAGAAWALAGLLRAIPFHAAQNRVFLPRTTMTANGVAMNELMAGTGSDGLARTVAAVAQAARDRHVEAVGNLSPVPRIARGALAWLPLVGVDLRRLEKAGYDVFALGTPSPFVRQCRMTVAALTGKF